jgi:GNAT superfamily N-acetyltransferase
MDAVRMARPADIPAVIELTERWATEPSTTGHYPVNFPEALRERIGPYFWVAECEGQVVGFIVGTVNGDASNRLIYQVCRPGEAHLSLHQIYVHPDHRNRGLGSRLVTCLFEEAAAHGIHRHLVMSANTDWPRTMRFYARHGFRPWYFKMFTGSSTEECPEATGDGEPRLISSS